MHAPTDAPIRVSVDRPDAFAYERDLEIEVLIQAITALRQADMLSGDEYEAKRRRLTDCA
ncbi:MAG: hypothetical protein ACE37B_12380 [Ilumatobacter sp.]|uniref:hypothetical protein n=1 Tax=Ilumatobacter sp. TaxID=1967498 RepID=UPI003918B47F